VVVMLLVVALDRVLHLCNLQKKAKVR